MDIVYKKKSNSKNTTSSQTSLQNYEAKSPLRKKIDEKNSIK